MSSSSEEKAIAVATKPQLSDSREVDSERMYCMMETLSELR